MMGGMHAPESIKRSVVLEEVHFATPLDRLVIVEFNRKSETRDKHMFGANPKWLNSKCMWAEARVIKSGRDSKASKKDVVRYPSDRESDSVCM